MKLIQHGCPHCSGDLIKNYDDELEYHCFLCARDFADRRISDILAERRRLLNDIRPSRLRLVQTV